MVSVPPRTCRACTVEGFVVLSVRSLVSFFRTVGPVITFLSLLCTLFLSIGASYTLCKVTDKGFLCFIFQEETGGQRQLPPVEAGPAETPCKEAVDPLVRSLREHMYDSELDLQLYCAISGEDEPPCEPRSIFSRLLL